MCSFAVEPVNKLWAILFLFLVVIIKEKQQKKHCSILKWSAKRFVPSDGSTPPIGFSVRTAEFHRIFCWLNSEASSSTIYILYMLIYMKSDMFSFYPINLTSFALPSLLPFHRSGKQEEIIWLEIIVRLVVSTLCCVHAPLSGVASFAGQCVGRWRERRRDAGWREEQ